MRIDLHTHSSLSDGTESPAQLMASAARAGLDVVGLTDHDTDAGWEEAAAAVPASGVALVRGAEITTLWRGLSVHVVSYLHDPADAGLARLMATTRDSRPARARRIVERMIADGIPIMWEQVLALAGDPATIGRPHIADALVDAGRVPDRSAAFEHLLARSGPYYVEIEAPSPAEAVRVIAAAGGVSVIAHPFHEARGGSLTESEIRGLAAEGLDGIEADHRDHTPEARERARALGEELGLIVTGSSDYHGDGKPNRLGEGLTSPEALRRIEEAGTLPVIRP